MKKLIYFVIACLILQQVPLAALEQPLALTQKRAKSSIMQKMLAAKLKLKKKLTSKETIQSLKKHIRELAIGVGVKLALIIVAAIFFRFWDHYKAVRSAARQKEYEKEQAAEQQRIKIAEEQARKQREQTWAKEREREKQATALKEAEEEQKREEVVKEYQKKQQEERDQHDKEHEDLFLKDLEYVDQQIKNKDFKFAHLIGERAQEKINTIHNQEKKAALKQQLDEKEKELRQADKEYSEELHKRLQENFPALLDKDAPMTCDLYYAYKLDFERKIETIDNPEGKNRLICLIEPRIKEFKEKQNKLSEDIYKQHFLYQALPENMSRKELYDLLEKEKQLSSNYHDDILGLSYLRAMAREKENEIIQRIGNDSNKLAAILAKEQFGPEEQEAARHLLQEGFADHAKGIQLISNKLVRNNMDPKLAAQKTQFLFDQGANPFHVAEDIITNPAMPALITKQLIEALKKTEQGINSYLNAYGDSALHLAIENHASPETVKLLLEAQADPNLLSREWYGQKKSPLYRAIDAYEDATVFQTDKEKAFAFEHIKLLLAHNADPRIESDISGKKISALQYAKDKHVDQHVIDLLAGK